jgi:hypothetical protein
MKGHCNTCNHTGNVYVDVNEDGTNPVPYCPRCMSEDVTTDVAIQSQTFKRTTCIKPEEWTHKGYLD